MAKKKSAKKKSAALARRKPSTALARRPAPLQVLTPEESERAAGLGENIQLGQLGLVQIKLTPEEELILSEEVSPRDVQVKPTAHPTPYLSHPAYTRWFNRAFGRLGWGLVPASKPMLANGAVVCPYVLYIHGQPAAFAMGEQEYHANNKDQSYGDALEATVASALRRCAKRLGVGLELWDRDWLDRFIQQFCVCVTVEKGGEKKKQWRRKDVAPFYNEVGRSQRNAPAVLPAVPTSGQGGDRKGDVITVDLPERFRQPAYGASAEPITQPQRSRLWAIMKTSGRSEAELKTWLQARYGWTSTSQVTRDRYDEVCKSVEASGALPLREPGE